MEFVNVQDARVPALGLGTWRLSGAQCVEAVEEALAIGYRHIDTAQMYGNEAEVGRAIRASGVDPAELFVTTKLSSQVLSPADVRSSTQESLERLGLDRIDLLLLHQPVAERPLGPALEEMARLCDDGLVRWLGVSNFPVPMLEEAQAVTPLFAIQLEYHPFRSQDDQLGAARRHDLLFQAYSPLARGGAVADPPLREVADRLGVTPAQVSLRWLLDQPNVAPIPKASSREHLLDNWGALDVRLSDEDRRTLGGLAGRQRRAAEVGH